MTMNSDKTLTAHFVKVGGPRGKECPYSGSAPGSRLLVVIAAVVLIFRRLVGLETGRLLSTLALLLMG